MDVFKAVCFVLIQIHFLCLSHYTTHRAVCENVRPLSKVNSLTYPVRIAPLCK